jgi:hypothetical protein
LEIECVNASAGLGIVNPNEGPAMVVPRMAQEGDRTPAVNRHQPEIRRETRHGRGTFETPPESVLAAKRSQFSGVTPNLHFGRMIDVYLNRTLPAAVASAAYDRCAAGDRIGT